MTDVFVLLLILSVMRYSKGKIKNKKGVLKGVWGIMSGLFVSASLLMKEMDYDVLNQMEMFCLNIGWGVTVASLWAILFILMTVAVSISGFFISVFLSMKETDCGVLSQMEMFYFNIGWGGAMLFSAILFILVAIVITIVGCSLKTLFLYSYWVMFSLGRMILVFKSMISLFFKTGYFLCLTVPLSLSVFLKSMKGSTWGVLGIMSVILNFVLGYMMFWA